MKSETMDRTFAEYFGNRIYLFATVRAVDRLDPFRPKIQFVWLQFVLYRHLNDQGFPVYIPPVPLYTAISITILLLFVAVQPIDIKNGRSAMENKRFDP